MDTLEADTIGKILLLYVAPEGCQRSKHVAFASVLWPLEHGHGVELASGLSYAPNARDHPERSYARQILIGLCYASGIVFEPCRQPWRSVPLQAVEIVPHRMEAVTVCHVLDSAQDLARAYPHTVRYFEICLASGYVYVLQAAHFKAVDRLPRRTFANKYLAFKVVMAEYAFKLRQVADQ